MITRDDVPFHVSVLMGDRPVRWAPPELRRGDYDGRECTLEVFLADAREQLGLLEAIGEDDWAKIEAAAGGPVVYIFHTTKESQERYAAFLLGFDEGQPVDAKPAATNDEYRRRYVDKAAGQATPHREELHDAA